MKSSGHLDDGRLVGKVVSEQVDVDGGGHQDHFELGPLQDQTTDGAQQKVAVQVALVYLHNSTTTIQ